MKKYKKRKKKKAHLILISNGILLTGQTQQRPNSSSLQLLGFYKTTLMSLKLHIFNGYLATLIYQSNFNFLFSRTKCRIRPREMPAILILRHQIHQSLTELTWMTFVILKNQGRVFTFSRINVLTTKLLMDKFWGFHCPPYFNMTSCNSHY